MRLAPPPSTPVHAGDRDLGGQCTLSQTLPAYLEDRRQVLGHFQSLSLHRVDHILHPGAGAAMRQGGTVAIRARESKTAPDLPHWHRTPQPHRPGRGEGRRHAEARPSCHLAATAEAQPAERETGARAAPGLLEAVFRAQAPLTPLPGSPSSSHTLPTAPPPPRPHVTRISRDT